MQEELLETLRAGPGEAARREVAVAKIGPAPSRWTLRTIRVGNNLRFVGADRKTASLCFQAHETKNHRELEYVIGQRPCHTGRAVSEGG